MNPQSKAREYFLADSHLKIETGQEFRIAGTFPESGMLTGRYIHVIEKSAYDKAVEALKMYGKAAVYNPATDQNESIAYRVIQELGVECE